MIEPSPHAHHGKHTISDILSWMEAFSKYLAVLVSTKATSREEAAGLVAHMYQGVRLSLARGFKWLKYDTEFQELTSEKHARQWRDMSMQIYGTWLPQVCDTGLEGSSFAEGSKTDQGSRPGKNPEAFKRWDNSMYFKP